MKLADWPRESGSFEFSFTSKCVTYSRRYCYCCCCYDTRCTHSEHIHMDVFVTRYFIHTTLSICNHLFAFRFTLITNDSDFLRFAPTSTVDHAPAIRTVAAAIQIAHTQTSDSNLFSVFYRESNRSKSSTAYDSNNMLCKSQSEFLKSTIITRFPLYPFLCSDMWEWSDKNSLVVLPELPHTVDLTDILYSLGTDPPTKN